MSRAQWILDDSATVSLLGADGDRVQVDGMDIWSAEFEGLSSIGAHSVNRPSVDVPEVRFSPEAAQFSVEFRRDSHSRVALVAQLSKTPNGSPITILPTHDQIIHDGTWHYVDPSEALGIRDTLQKRNLALGLALTEEEILWLFWKSDLEITESDHRIHNIDTRHRSPEVSKTLVNATLYPYQMSGIEKLASLYEQGLGSLLADEMGLGKTLQVIALLVYGQSYGTSLVVCPASTLANWEREIARFAPGLSVQAHRGPRRSGSPSNLQASDIVLTSYETLTQDFHLLKNIDWNLFALDEAQNIKNPKSRRAQIAKSLTRRSSIAVTGTPIENSLEDLWSIMEFVAPSFLPQLSQFQLKYPDENQAASEVGRRVAATVIRRHVSDVASDLPDRVDTYMPIPMSDDQLQEYVSIRDSETSTLAKITNLRVCTADATDRFRNYKLAQLAATCSEAFSLDKKVLVFASFSTAIDDILQYMSSYSGISFANSIDGRTQIDDRQSLIDSFTEHNGPALLVMNPKAAGVGLNIQAASYVIHFTPEWNPAVVDQASARAFRRGQKNPVFVYYYYYDGSVEEIMIDRLKSKRELQTHGLAAASSEPSEEELLRILRSEPQGE